MYLRQPEEWTTDYRWKLEKPRRIRGILKDPENPREALVYQQKTNGIHWKLVLGDDGSGPRTRREGPQTRNEDCELVFRAHPDLHSFPWRVPGTVRNAGVVSALKKQPFKRFKGAGKGLTGLIRSLQKKAKASRWQKAAMEQTPTELWAHKSELTDYQVWVGYRVATGQLNLFHEGRPLDNSCRRTEQCEGVKETMEHIFWSCQIAQACWRTFIGKWTGVKSNTGSVEKYVEYCVSRKPPNIPHDRQRLLMTYEPDAELEMRAMWQRIWRIVCSVCMASLWMQRNRSIFEQEEIPEEQAVTEFWNTSMRQLRALAKRERRAPATRVTGTRLMLGTEILLHQPRETPPQVEPPSLTTGSEDSVLVKRLKTYQMSSNR